MELKPLYFCGIIDNGLGRKTYFYDERLATPNCIRGNYEWQRSDRHRYIFSDLFCYRVRCRYDEHDTDLSAAAVGHCNDHRRTERKTSDEKSF